jgi:uncharacterized protein (DUF1684 family)
MTIQRPQERVHERVRASAAGRGQGVDSFVAAWLRWRAERDAELVDPHGFLAVTGLHWLTGEPERFDDAPGEWHSGPDGVVVVLGEGEELTVRGKVVRGEYRFGAVPERGGIRARWGDAVIEVARRGGRDIVRPRHPENPLRTSYAGTPTYPPQRRWVLAGRYEPFDEPRPTTVGAVVPGLDHVYDAPGEIVVELDGRPVRLLAFGGSGALTVLFTDATSGITTYGASRELSVAAPGPDGAVVVDFNRASNLPCAYTDLATCPLPPAQNRLPVPVDAGEKIPYERGGSS